MLLVLQTVPASISEVSFSLALCVDKMENPLARSDVRTEPETVLTSVALSVFNRGLQACGSENQSRPNACASKERTCNQARFKRDATRLQIQE